MIATQATDDSTPTLIAPVESLVTFRLVGDRHRAAFSELLLGEGIARGAHPVADLALQQADIEFAALGDD